MAERTIITIGRGFGSGGREIGKALANSMGISYFDRELLEVAAKESGISRELFEHNDEKPTSSLLYSLSVNPYSVSNMLGMQNTPINQAIFLAQFDAIRKVAARQDCVIVGRCADYALRDVSGCFNVFIHAPLEYRIERVKASSDLNAGQAKDLIVKTDKQRAAYYNTYSDKKWGDISNYHLAFDSSLLSTADAVKLIEHFSSSRK